MLTQTDRPLDTKFYFAPHLAESGPDADLEHLEDLVQQDINTEMTSDEIMKIIASDL